MEVAAIIAEYNPLHNGHAYQIEQTKKETGADYVIAFMSGDFVQRGAPALLDKYTRTRMALLCGTDAVIELPTLYAAASAEYFAQGAVTLMSQLGVVDLLSFGSESGELSSLTKAAELLLSREPADLTQLLKKGLSYPAARTQSFSSLSGDLQDLLSSPNNILGAEYCKALFASHSKIRPFTIARKGNGYHDLSLQPGSEDFSSASSIRAFLSREAAGNAVKNPDLLLPLHKQMPKEAFALLCAAVKNRAYLFEDDFSALLYYQLLKEADNGYSDFLDCSSSLSDKITKNLCSYQGYEAFCMQLKSKDLTYTRISRTLLHILLGIKTPSCFLEPYSSRKLPVPYARLLGFRKSAAPLLSAMKANSSIPLLSKMAAAKDLLSGEDLAFFQAEVRYASLYQGVLALKTGTPILNEYCCSPISID